MVHAGGPLLTVDVTDRAATRTDITDLLAETVGGRATATHLAHDRVPFDADYADLLAVGAGVVERERHFNNRRGFDVADDALPYEVPDLDDSVREYYARRGWSEEGVVPEGRVEERGEPADD